MFNVKSCCLLVLLLVASCQSKQDLPQDPDIQVYFNHRESSSYRDPYRKIKRSGDNLERVIIDAIADANNTIDVAVQELQLPLISEALAKKAQEGVKVRIVLENQYSSPVSTIASQLNRLSQREKNRYQQYIQLIDRDGNGVIDPEEANNNDALVILKNAGIKVIDDTADGSKGSGLMHHKFVVIDGVKVLTGSNNYTLSGIHGDLNAPLTRGNANHLLVINRPEVARLFSSEFDYLWGENDSPQFGLDKPYRPPVTLSWKDTSITVQFAPTSKTKGWEATTNGLIGTAIERSQQSVDMALFVFSEQPLADILQDQDGIAIRGLIDDEFIFRYYSEALDLLGVAMLNNCKYEADNNPWQQPITTIGTANLTAGDKLHHKFAIVDNQTVITGSQNWSAAANYSNDEAVIIIENATVAKQFQQEFDRLYQRAFLGLPTTIREKIAKEQRC